MQWFFLIVLLKLSNLHIRRLTYRIGAAGSSSFCISLMKIMENIFFIIVASLLSRKTQDPVDAIIFTIGIQTVLRQFPTSVFNSYIAHLCKYILCFVSADRYETIPYAFQLLASAVQSIYNSTLFFFQRKNQQRVGIRGSNWTSLSSAASQIFRPIEIRHTREHSRYRARSVQEDGKIINTKINETYIVTKI